MNDFIIQLLKTVIILAFAFFQKFECAAFLKKKWFALKKLWFKQEESLLV